MLVLTRKIGEHIIVRVPGSREIMIKISDIRPGRVRIGIEAPADVKISRPERAEAHASGYELAVDDAARRILDQTMFQDEYSDR